MLILCVHIYCHLVCLIYYFLCSVYGDSIPVKELADRVASYVHLCTLYWWLRLDAK